MEKVKIIFFQSGIQIALWINFLNKENALIWLNLILR